MAQIVIQLPNHYWDKPWVTRDLHFCLYSFLCSCTCPRYFVLRRPCIPRVVAVLMLLQMNLCMHTAVVLTDMWAFFLGDAPSIVPYWLVPGTLTAIHLTYLDAKFQGIAITVSGADTSACLPDLVAWTGLPVFGYYKENLVFYQTVL